MKIEFLGVAQIPNEPYGLHNKNGSTLKSLSHWTTKPQIVAVLSVTGSSKGIPNGIRSYDKSVLPYMRMLNGVNGVLQSENPGANLQALEDAMNAVAETEKNVAAGRQSANLLPLYPRDFPAVPHSEGAPVPGDVKKPTVQGPATRQ